MANNNSRVRCNIVKRGVAITAASGRPRENARNEIIGVHGTVIKSKYNLKSEHDYSSERQVAKKVTIR